MPRWANKLHSRGASFGYHAAVADRRIWDDPAHWQRRRAALARRLREYARLEKRWVTVAGIMIVRRSEAVWRLSLVSVEPGLYRAERRFLRLCATDRSLFRISRAARGCSSSFSIHAPDLRSGTRGVRGGKRPHP